MKLVLDKINKDSRVVFFNISEYEDKEMEGKIKLTIIPESQDTMVIECDSYKVEEGFLKMDNAKIEGKTEQAKQLWVLVGLIKIMMVS
jgi:hypothetical protein